MSQPAKSFVAGLLFMLFGAVFVIAALAELPLGSALAMGPGYFPTLLGGVLIVLGGIAAWSGWQSAPIGDGAVPWRAIVMVLLAPIVLGLTVRGIGFIGATFLAVAVACFARKQTSWLMVALVSVVLTAFCTAVFIYGLNLPLRLVGPWLTF